MGDVVVLLIQKYGWAALAVGMFFYFVTEMALDVVGDLVSEAIRDWLDVRAGRKPR